MLTKQIRIDSKDAQLLKNEVYLRIIEANPCLKGKVMSYSDIISILIKHALGEDEWMNS